MDYEQFLIRGKKNELISNKDYSLVYACWEGAYRLNAHTTSKEMTESIQNFTGLKL